MLGSGWLRKQPPRVPTDEVLPALFFDDTPMVNPVVIRWMVRFDDVLDPEKLHLSLARLLEMGSWRRLGGRFRLNKQGKREIHVPKAFDSKRPAVRFSHVSFDTAISEHPLANRLPRATEKPSIQEGGHVFRELGIRDGDKLPEKLEDYLHSDEPPLALQVVSFTDATLVSLTFPHSLTDAVGLSALITNWCKVLAGREDEVAPLVEDDVLGAIGARREQDGERHVLDAKKLIGLAFSLFVVHFLFDLLFGPKMETRLIFLPAKSFRALKQQANDDLSVGSLPDRSGPSGDASGKLFVSEGDVLTAWGTKMVALSLGPKSTRTMTVMNVFELRSRLKPIFNSTTAYVQNAFFVLNTIITAQDARAMPVGQIALRLRTSLVEQTTVPQIEALVREQRHALEKAGRPVLFAESNSMLLPFSNWSKAKFFEVVDFGPAVLKPGRHAEGRVTATGKPVFFHSTDASPRPNPTYRNVFNVLGKDPEGNYWITGMLSPATWSVIKESLKHL